VGDENPSRADFEPRQFGQKRSRIAARVDDSRFPRRPVGPHDVAIRLELAQREMVDGKRHRRA